MQIRWMFPTVASALITLACGGGGAPEAASPADVDDAEVEAPADKAEPEAAEAAPEEEPEPAAEEPTEEAVNPKDVLLKEGTAFMIDHGKSDVGIKAEEKCEQKAGDDVAKKANCISRAFNRFKREGILFEQKNGAWWYVRFIVRKGAKIEQNRIQIEPGEPKGAEVVFKTFGRDKARKTKAPSELRFEVPNEYEITLHDPRMGKLVLEPKMGLINK